MVYIETLTAPFVCLGEIGVAVIIKTQVQLRSIRYSFFVMKSLIKEVCVRPYSTINDYICAYRLSLNKIVQYGTFLVVLILVVACNQDKRKEVAVQSVTNK